MIIRKMVDCSLGWQQEAFKKLSSSEATKKQAPLGLKGACYTNLLLQYFLIAFFHVKQTKKSVVPCKIWDGGFSFALNVIKT